MTKEEAEKEVIRLNDEPIQWYCPLLRFPCRNDCVCFVKARVHTRIWNNGREEHSVFEPFCGNAMFNNQCGCQ